MLDQLLEALVVSEGGLEFGHLLGGHIAGHVAPVFVALVIVVGAVGALAQDADGTAVQALDLRQVPEEGFGGDWGLHVRRVYAIDI